MINQNLRAQGLTGENVPGCQALHSTCGKRPTQKKTLISSIPTTKHYYSGTIRYYILCAVALAAAGSFWVSRFLLWQMVYTKATKTNTVPTQQSTFACIISQSERQSLKQSILPTIPSVSPTCSSYTQKRSLDPGWIDGAPSKNTKHLDQWHATRSMINKSLPFQGLNIMRILIIIPTQGGGLQ